MCLKGKSSSSGIYSFELAKEELLSETVIVPYESIKPVNEYCDISSEEIGAYF